MPWLLFAIFVVIPFTEIILFIIIGDQIGIAATLVLVVFTAILGSFLLQKQGLSTLQRAQKAMAEGHMPVGSVIDGVCLLFAGAFLLTPGFFTDGIGFLLFVPGLRHRLAMWVLARLSNSSSVRFEYDEMGRGGGPHDRGEKRYGPLDDDGPIIEGDYERKSEPRPSGSGVPLTGKKDSPWRREEEDR